MSLHAPEPYSTCEACSGEQMQLLDAKGRVIAHASRWDGDSIGSADDDFARIVACVNAMSGIPACDLPKVRAVWDSQESKPCPDCGEREMHVTTRCRECGWETVRITQLAPTPNSEKNDPWEWLKACVTQDGEGYKLVSPAGGVMAITSAQRKRMLGAIAVYDAMRRGDGLTEHPGPQLGDEP